MSYEVEDILDHKNMGMFLVKWKGFKEPTWEPLKNLDGCKDLLADFTFLEHVREDLAEEDSSSDSSHEDGQDLSTPDEPCHYLSSGSSTSSSDSSSSASLCLLADDTSSSQDSIVTRRLIIYESDTDDDDAQQLATDNISAEE